MRRTHRLEQNEEQRAKDEQIKINKVLDRPYINEDKEEEGED